MADKISIHFDEKELEAILDNALTDVKRETEKAAKISAREAVAELKVKSPRRPGHGEYADGWDFQKSEESDIGYVTWNPKHYRLTHLLEKGHQVCNQHGGPWGRARAHRHIKPVEQAESVKFLQRVQAMKFR